MLSAPIPDDDELRLAALRAYGILDSEREQTYDDVTALAAYICEAPFSTITLVDRDRQWFKSEVGFGIPETQRSDAFCAHAILKTEVMVVEDTHEDPRFRDNPYVVGPPGIRFYAGAPLVTSEGFVLGTVCVFDTRPRSLRKNQVAALEALARQVMSHMELRLRVARGERQEQALRTAEKLAVVGRLASSMAHEINNPLQSVTNLLFMAGMTTEDPGKAYVDQALDELGRVTHIVTQTLRFHSQSENSEPVRLGEITESVATLFRTRLQHASAELRLQDGQSGLLLGFASDLRQVLANLLSNALDAVLGQARREICFRIRDTRHVRHGKSGVSLLISDSGAGMSAETLSHLYEPFYSTKGARGTGLGLWVSQGILGKHKAQVRVRSSTGPRRQGTTFRIFFPHAILEPAVSCAPTEAIDGGDFGLAAPDRDALDAHGWHSSGATEE